MRLLLAALVILVLSVSSASAQSCNVGVYLNPDATGQFIFPSHLTSFDVYVVMFLEDTIDAITYNLSAPAMYDPSTNPGGNLFLTGSFYGPSESGILIEGPGGDYIGLGVCSNGFGGSPVVVARYSFLYASTPATSEIRVAANTDLGYVQYATCAGELKSCQIGPYVIIDYPVAAGAPSWGAVKGLYDTN